MIGSCTKVNFGKQKQVYQINRLLQGTNEGTPELEQSTLVTIGKPISVY